MARQKLLLGIASAAIGAVTLVGSGRAIPTGRRTDESKPADTDAVGSPDASSGLRRRLRRKTTAAVDPVFRQP